MPQPTVPRPAVTGPDDGDVPVGGLKLLLVDDIQENLDLLQDVLAEHNYTSVFARNGVEALVKLRQEKVHLIVADAMMPMMDGFQLCKEVRALPGCASLPFIIYTGNYVDETHQRLAHSIGVDKYVVKYAGLGALVDAVNELVQQRYGRRAIAPAPAAEQIDEHLFLEQHRAIVIRKLEEKMAELEMNADMLVRKNREIQASEERYRAMFDHASIAIFVTDHESGRILDVNRQALALLSYTKEEVLAMPFVPFGTEPGTPITGAGSALYTSGETTIRTKSGELIQVDVVVGPVTRPQDPRVMLFVRDVTEKKKMQAQLLQAEKLTLMGRLAAGIAHEIRNPLAAVTLNLQYLVGKLGADATLRQTLDDMLEAARRIETVVGNTLNLARVAPPVLELNQLNGLIDHVIRYVKIALQQKRITIEARLDRNIPSILADARQIQQVMINVLQNAIDASPEGSILTVSTGFVVEPRTDAPQGTVRKAVVEIRDRGAGIPPDQVKQIFESFRTTKAGGTGLGLALSKFIMDRHHAEIRIEAAVGGGTLVRLVFPLQG
jgi:PAS domain S-box-containing protein